MKREIPLFAFPSDLVVSASVHPEVLPFFVFVSRKLSIVAYSSRFSTISHAYLLASIFYSHIPSHDHVGVVDAGVVTALEQRRNEKKMKPANSDDPEVNKYPCLNGKNAGGGGEGVICMKSTSRQRGGTSG